MIVIAEEKDDNGLWRQVRIIDAETITEAMDEYLEVYDFSVGASHLRTRHDYSIGILIFEDEYEIRFSEQDEDERDF